MRSAQHQPRYSGLSVVKTVNTSRGRYFLHLTVRYVNAKRSCAAHQTKVVRLARSALLENGSCDPVSTARARLLAG